MANAVPPGRTARLASLNGRVVASTRSTPLTDSTASWSEVLSAIAKHGNDVALCAMKDVCAEARGLDAFDHRVGGTGAGLLLHDDDHRPPSVPTVA